MKTIRSKLTRLKSLIDEKLPDESDIFGFEGINKELIFSFIDEAYNLSSSFDKALDDEDKFELIILKRKLTNHINNCKKYLKDEILSWNKVDKFNNFLDNLIKIKEEIKITHLVIIDKALKTEAITNSIIDGYEDISEAYNTYKDQFIEISEKYDGFISAYDESQKLKKELDLLTDSTNETVSKIETFKENTVSLYDDTTYLESEIKEKSSNINESLENLNTLEQKAKSLNENLNELTITNKELKDIFKKQIELNQQKQDEIHETLDNANRMGMASSFKKRKDELKAPLISWATIFICVYQFYFYYQYCVLRT